MTQIFISYSRVDKKFTKALAELLGHAYDNVWYDTAKLVGGDDWWETILAQIKTCDHFIFLLSPESIASEFCQKELAEAIKLNKHVIPIRIRERTTIPKTLEFLHCIDSFDEVDVNALNKIYASIIRFSVNLISTENSKKRYTSDLKLLHRFWKLIHTNLITWLDDATQNYYVEKDLLNASFIKYQHIRKKSENHFFAQNLEDGFSNFDIKLSVYIENLFAGFSFGGEDNNRDYLVSHIKLVYYNNPKDFEYQRNLYEKAVSAVLELKTEHMMLIDTIRYAIPDFDFRVNEET